MGEAGTFRCLQIVISDLKSCQHLDGFSGNIRDFNDWFRLIMRMSDQTLYVEAIQLQIYTNYYK